MGCGCGKGAPKAYKEERSGLVKSHQADAHDSVSLPSQSVPDKQLHGKHVSSKEVKLEQCDDVLALQPPSKVENMQTQAAPDGAHPDGEVVSKEIQSEPAKVPGQFTVDDRVAVGNADSKAFGIIKAGPDDDGEYLVDWDNGDTSSYHAASDLIHESLTSIENQAPARDELPEGDAVSKEMSPILRKVPGQFTVDDRVAVLNAGSKALGVVKAGPDDDGEFLVDWDNGDTSTYHVASDLIHESLVEDDIKPSREEEVAEGESRVVSQSADELIQDKTGDDLDVAPSAELEVTKEPQSQQSENLAELSWEELIARGDVQPSFSWMEAAAANQSKTLEWFLAAQEQPQELLESKDATKQTALHVASKNGAAQACQLLIEHKADLLAQDKTRQIPLHLAAREGHLEVVQFLLDPPETVNKTEESEETCPGLSVLDLWRRTPLHKAAEGGNSDIFTLLLERHVNLAASDREGNNVLHFAIIEGCSHIVKIVLQNQKDPLMFSAANKEDCSPLDLCVQVGLNEAGDDLVAAGAKLVKDMRKNPPTLHGAIHKGLPFLCTYLLERSSVHSSTSAKKLLAEADENGRTPAGLAAHLGCQEVLTRLLNSQADLSCEQPSGLQPLHEASRSGHVEVMSYLLEQSVPADGTDADGQTVLFHASAGGHVNACLWLCKSDGICHDLVECDHRERTALHAAAEAGQADACECLLEQCTCDRIELLNMEDWEGFTAAHLAVCAGHVDVCRLLSREKAQLYAALDFGGSTLQSAAEQGHTDVVKLLLDELASGTAEEVSEALAVKRASDGRNAWLQSASQGHLENCRLLRQVYVDAKLADVCDRDQRNAFMLAAQGGHKSTCEWLLKEDIIPDALQVSDACGWRALHVAAAEGRKNVIEWLLDADADATAVDEEGRSAAVWAGLRGHLGVEALLQRAESSAAK